LKNKKGRWVEAGVRQVKDSKKNRWDGEKLCPFASKRSESITWSSRQKVPEGYPGNRRNPRSKQKELPKKKKKIKKEQP